MSATDKFWNTLAIALSHDDTPRNRAMIDREFAFVLGAPDRETREIERMIARAANERLHAERRHRRHLDAARVTFSPRPASNGQKNRWSRS